MDLKTFFSAKNQRNILIVILIILLIGGYLFYNKYQKDKTNLNIANQNIKALTDSLRISKTKNGNLEYSINTLITDKKGLAKFNADLADQYKKEHGKVYELNQVVAELKNKGPIVINNTLIKYPNGIFGLKWRDSTVFSKYNSRIIRGESKFSIDTLKGIINPLTTTIIKNSVTFNLFVGLRENKGNLEIFANSDYPDLIITHLEGAQIDVNKNPVFKNFIKPKKFSIGFHLGYGAQLYNKQIFVGPQVGVSIHYNLFSF